MGPESSSGIPVFNREFFDASETFTRIGSGALGGKASGLKAVRDDILAALGPEEFPYIEVVVPTLTVLTTEVFETFMTRNALYPAALADASDDRIAHAFQRAELPAEVVGDLRALISRVHTPLAVRSSSLLEDALEHPFAGVYATKMIPNNEIEEDARFRRLTEAVKFVYASTFFREAKAYIRSVGRDLEAERMAVIVQEVVGQLGGKRYYPCISGVARSYNYYPAGSSRAEEGVVNLALGLGKTIVDGGMSWTYCPAFPKAPPPFNNIGDLLKNTQTEFWAVNMGEPPLPDPIAETEYLVKLGLPDAESDGTLRHLVSTYNPASDRLDPGLGAAGARALTFAPILGSPFVPFNDLLKRLLELSEQKVGSAVEIEFAVNLERNDLLPARVGFLQVRPMMVGDETLEVGDHELTGDDVVVASTNVLGNGSRTGIRDVVFLKPEAFDQSQTQLIARELEDINRELADDGRTYVLIGFGRWGTSDPWLGVPIVWPQISGARVIVEATLENINPDMSQGSHFFHNLLSFQVLYLSVAHYESHAIDWQWLNQQDTLAETRFVKHIRVAEDLVVRVDGTRRRGVVRRHGC